MIKNIIFDIGNVLGDFIWKQTYEGFGFPSDVIERVAKATVLSAEWNEYDRGVWTDEQIIDAFVKNDPSVEQEIRYTQDHLTGIVKKNDYAIPWLTELKSQGYGLYYLSNFSKRIQDVCEDGLSFLPLMDGGIFSYKVHQIKPDREIYETLLRTYKLIAEECVFIDDREENVLAAKALGFSVIQFQNEIQARNELNRLIAHAVKENCFTSTVIRSYILES